jgi:two-component system cell cycle sensor histidine kinase PleC
MTRFVQLESQHNRNHEGTGLGLPLSKALVELHGGTLDLQSEIGVGTTATVRFPAERIVASQDNSDSLGGEDRAAS